MHFFKEVVRIGEMKEQSQFIMYKTVKNHNHCEFF